MEPQRVEPLVGALNFFSVLPSMLMGQTPELLGRDTIGDITIDTCVAMDTDIPETGIERLNIEGKWIIVEQYKNKEEAIKGHDKWVKLMTEYPDFPLKDIDMWSLSNLGKGVE